MGIPPWEMENAPFYWLVRILAYMEGEKLFHDWEKLKQK
jgi:hypothetical protein